MRALFFRTYLFALRGLSLVEGRGYSLVAMRGFSSQWLSCCGALVLGMQASVVAPRCVESSLTRDRTCVPCLGRGPLNQGTTREVACVL